MNQCSSYYRNGIFCFVLISNCNEISPIIAVRRKGARHGITEPHLSDSTLRLAIQTTRDHEMYPRQLWRLCFHRNTPIQRQAYESESAGSRNILFAQGGRKSACSGFQRDDRIGNPQAPGSGTPTALTSHPARAAPRGNPKRYLPGRVPMFRSAGAEFRRSEIDPREKRSAGTPRPPSRLYLPL